MSLHQEAAEFFARWKAARPQHFAARPKPAQVPQPVTPEEIEAARAELAALEPRHDPYYGYQDDPVEFRRGQAIADRIGRLRAFIAKHGSAA